MKIDKTQYNIISTFKCSGHKYALVQEKVSEEGLEFLGKGYRVINEGLETVDSRFWDTQVKESDCKTPFEFIKTEDFYYGFLKEAIEVKESSVFEDSEKKQPKYAPYAYYYEEKQREREAGIYD